MEGVASQLQTHYFTIYNTDFKIELVSLSAKAVSDISSDFFRVNIKRDVKRYSRIVLKTWGLQQSVSITQFTLKRSNGCSLT